MNANKRSMAVAMVEANKAGGGGARGARLVEKAFREGDFTVKDFSIRALGEACYGRDWVESGLPGQSGARYIESGGGAVDHTTFSNLTTVVIRGLMDEPSREVDLNLGESLATNTPTEFEQGEKVIGLRRVGREANGVIRAGESYPRYSYGEDWQTKPDTEKRGGIIELTKEAIREDRTGRILEHARTLVDESIANKNERLLLAILGVQNSIFRPKGVVEATYTTATTGLDDNARVNLLASNELVDWTDIEAAELLWAEMRHKDSGRPIQIADGRMQMLVMPAKWRTALHILNANEVTVGTETTAPNGRRTGGNPVAGSGITPMSSNLAYALLTRSASDPYLPGGGVSASDAKKYWYLGDFPRAFEYLENWPLTVETMGPGSYAGWDADVEFGIKVSEKGVVAIRDPRYVLQLRG